MPLWEQDADLYLLRGGRGGGKSEAVFDRLIVECEEADYFRCYYGRKVFDTVRGSCFKTLIECLKKQNKAHLFTFSEADNSSMVVTHKASGFQFIPFGGDKADKLKSIKDPTHIVCEEFDQFDFADFKDLYPTLRTERGANKFYAMFNTHGVYPNHWLMRVFFPDMYSGDERIDVDALEGVKVCHIFANYSDNHFIDQDAYKSKLLLAAGGNMRLFEAIANGAWGVEDNDNPWLYNFEYDKHVKEVPFLPSFPVYLSFDFNIDPFACTIWQMSPHKGGESSFIHCIDEVVGLIKIEEMCAKIRTKFPKSILYVTGDRSGQSRELGRNNTIYQSIATALGISSKNLILNNSNLEHADSRELLNTMFYHYRIAIHPRCKTFIQDCEKAKVDTKSSKPSHLLKDRGLYKMDAFDSGRYFFQTFFLDYAQKTYWKALRKV